MRLIDADTIEYDYYTDDIEVVDENGNVDTYFEKACTEYQVEHTVSINPYKVVLDDLKNIELFCGKYDAEHGNEHFIYGIWTVMECIAEKAGVHDEFDDEFNKNMSISKWGKDSEE